jgi:hypothetical protein
MGILPSTASLLARQVRLLISPPTSTLFESRAIFSKVESRFGSIATFINQRNDQVLDRVLRSGTITTASPPQAPFHTILAVFDSATSKEAALNSRPFTIACGGELVPSAEELDPYNARGLHGRHHPPKRTFTCQIVDEEDPAIHRRLAEKHPYAGPFHLDMVQISYRDLVRAGAPLQEMADVMQIGRVEQQQKHEWQDEESRATERRYFYSVSDRLRDAQHKGGLMAAWRRGIEERIEQEQQQGSELISEEQ